jgi:hypothetical protein
MEESDDKAGQGSATASGGKADGWLEPFWETGTEGIHWSLTDPLLPGYVGLFRVEGGDPLTILSVEGEVVWTGTVQLEHERRLRSAPGNPSYRQQEIDGFWVHGLEASLPPETWSRWFHERLPAVLTLDAGACRTYPSPDLAIALRACSADEGYSAYGVNQHWNRGLAELPAACAGLGLDLLAMPGFLNCPPGELVPLPMGLPDDEGPTARPGPLLRLLLLVSIWRRVAAGACRPEPAILVELSDERLLAVRNAL